MSTVIYKLGEKEFSFHTALQTNSMPLIGVEQNLLEEIKKDKHKNHPDDKGMIHDVTLFDDGGEIAITPDFKDYGTLTIIKRMKTFCITLLVLLMSNISITAFAYDIGVESDDGNIIYYNYINDGKELEVVEVSMKYGVGTLRIPSEVTYYGRTRKVTSIGEDAFQGIEKVSCLYLPPTINKISKLAYCWSYDNLKVVISDFKAFCELGFGVAIEPYYNDVYYDMRNGLWPKMQYDLYYENEETLVTDLVVPEGVKNLCGLAHCKSLKTITTSSSVETISDCYDCANLTTVDMQASKISLIKEAAFLGCKNLKSISFGKIKKIEAESFVDCADEMNIILKDISEWCNVDLEITAIAKRAGWWINSSQIILFSDEKTEVLDLEIPNGVKAIKAGVFSNFRIRSVKIPSSVTIIGNMEKKAKGAFSSCPLEKVSFGNGVKSIGTESFWHCTKLRNISWGDGIETIGISAFSNCDLRSISLPPNIILNQAAFYGNKKLKMVIIPIRIAEIGESVFVSCDSLMTVVSLIKEELPVAGVYGINTGFRNAFGKNTLMNATLYVPEGTIDMYKSTDGWKDFVWIEEGLPASIETAKTDGEVIEKSRYTVDGSRLSSPRRGINIIKMSDGTIKKELVK